MHLTIWHLKVTSVQLSHNFFTEIVYSNASRYAASKCVDLTDTRFWIHSKNTWGTRILTKNHADNWILHWFWLILARNAGIFWGLTNIMLRDFWNTRAFFSGIKNRLTRGFTVYWLNWTWNLNFPPITVNNKFKFQAQDSFLEYFHFEDWEIWKTNHTFWKKTPLANWVMVRTLDSRIDIIE